MKTPGLYLLLLAGLVACRPETGTPIEQTLAVNRAPGAIVDSGQHARPEADSLVYDHPDAPRIHTGAVTPEEVVAFARTLKGIPYGYASCTPETGFDCSGFVYYVFSHFGITVPRSSSDFTNIGKEVARSAAKPGDLILFTGTDSTVRKVGHIGIVVSNSPDSLIFIHSSSGSENGVTMTPLDDYYLGRFIKVIRIFKRNEPLG